MADSKDDKKFNDTLKRLMDQKPKPQEDVKETAAKDRKEARRKALRPDDPIKRRFRDS
ncbi:hypothetical protein KUV46_11155 [Thalassovita mediterranea]|nr:hypothetical protein KUV46_11155 [Thalassovita mediterranea]